MVRIKYQPTVCRIGMLLATMEYNRKYMKKCNFLNLNLIFERNHVEDDFDHEIIHRIFNYKFLFCCLHLQGDLFIHVDWSCSDGKIQILTDGL